MNDQHHSAHELELERLLAEAADPRRALVGSRLEQCDVCRSDLEQMLGVSELIDSAARDERATLAASAALRDVPGEQMVEAVLRPRLAVPSGADSPADARSRRAIWLVPALAAAIVLALFVLRDRFTPRPSPPVTLGPGVPTALNPHGSVLQWGTFEWTGELPPNGRFVVVVRVADDEARVLAESPRLVEHSWTPTNTQMWQRVRWQVLVYDGQSVAASSPAVEAWLSAR